MISWCLYVISFAVSFAFKLDSPNKHITCLLKKTSHLLLLPKTYCIYNTIYIKHIFDHRVLMSSFGKRYLSNINTLLHVIIVLNDNVTKGLDQQS